TLSATFAPSNHLATSGIDYVSNSIANVWPEAFYMTNFATLYSTNYTPFGVGLVGAKFFQIPLLDDNLQEGDETVDLRFIRPDASITLGGEYIPLGGAYGRASATLTIA